MPAWLTIFLATCTNSFIFILWTSYCRAIWVLMQFACLRMSSSNTQASLEIIVVDYCTDENNVRRGKSTRGLLDVLSHPQLRVSGGCSASNIKLRVLTVQHCTRNQSQPVFREYFAKNIGIRAAKGRYSTSCFQSFIFYESHLF